MTKASVWEEFVNMLLLTFVCAALLVGTHYAIGESADLSRKSIDSFCTIIDKGKGSKPTYESFLNSFKLVRKGKIKLWQGIATPSMIACEANGMGMWGEITLVFLYDASESRILGLKVTEQNETPGLGDRILEEEFSQQFVNWKGEPIDGITGATISSRAVEKILAKSLSAIELLR